MKRQVTFITERLPKEGSSGAESYNHYICQLLINLGYEINIIVTGDYFYSPIFIDKKRLNKPFLKAKYVHCTSISRLNISTSIKSYLRPIKKLISNIFLKTSDKSKNLKIGRFISQNEAEAAKRLIPSNTNILLFDTIFRYHSLFNETSYPKILIAHDVFSLRSDSFTNQGFKVTPHIKKNSETEIWQDFDLTLAINEDEKQFISESTSNLVCTIFPRYKIKNNANKSTWQKSQNILYIGANAHHNIHGLKRFIAQIWPEVIKAHPDAHLKVIGNIADSFRGKNIKNIDFLGRVNDLNTVAQTCAFAINPVYMGSGVKIKILDYLSLGLPCITTSVGIMGFVRQEQMPIAETKDDNEFSKQTITWLESEDKLNIAKHSILGYTKNFSQESSQNILESNLERAIKNGS